MSEEELNELEQAVHDSWSLLNLTIAGMQGALMSTDLIEGEANTPSAVYRIGDDDLSTLWGALEAMRQVRGMLWDQLQKV